MTRIAILLATVISVLSTEAHAQYHKQRGATVGGLTGAIAGSLIGDNNGSAGTGAVIGGVVGAVTGGLIGDARDQQEWVQRRREAVRNSAPLGSITYPQTRAVNHSVTPEDILEMHRAGLSDQVIINQIQQRGVQRPLTVQDIIGLHQQGVGEPLLTALQQAKVQSTQSRASRSISPSVQYVPVPSTTTIWMSSPNYRSYCPPIYQPYHQHRYYYRPNTNFGFHLRF